MSKDAKFKKIEGKKGKDSALAYLGFDLCSLPYKKEDVFAERSQKRLEQDTFDYIPFTTLDNSLLDNIYLITHNSPTVSSIIAQKTAYTIAGGLMAVPSSQLNPLKKVRELRAVEISDDDLEEFNDFLIEVNGQGQSMIEVVEDAARNLWSFGNCFLEVYILPNKELRFKVLSPFLCRPKKAPENQMYPKEVGVSIQWQEIGGTDYDVIDYPIFPEFKKIDGAQRSIIHIKFDTPNFYYWGAPDWIAAKLWGELEYRMAKYNQGKFENGFTPSAIISAYGFTNKPEAENFVNSMKSCFTGTGNNSKMFIQALRDETSKMDVQILDSQSDGEFLNLAQLSREEIITASRWSQALAGLSTAGQLGSNQQIRSEFDIVYSNVIRPVQKKIMRAINKAIKEGISRGVTGLSSNIALDLLKVMPVTFAGDVDPQEVLFVNELREDLGREPLEGGEIFINSKSGKNGNTDTN
jgi:hypothetical protein